MTSSSPRLVSPASAEPDRTDNTMSPSTSGGSRRRFAALIVLFCILGLVLIAQLVRYQIFQPDLPDPSPLAQTGPSPRGAIVDSEGTPLVVNRYYFQLTATPAHFKNTEERDAVGHRRLGGQSRRQGSHLSAGGGGGSLLL